MIRVLATCSVAGSFILAMSAGHAAPAKPGERASRPAVTLESADPAVRRDAITKLVSDRDPTAAAQLALALEGDDDESVRQAAASGLGDLADKRGTGALKRCLKMEPSQAVKRSCRVSLARLDPQAATTEPEPAVATSSAGAMGTTAPPGAPATPSGTAAPGSQIDLRIEVTAQDAAARPNHVYVELWSAIDKNTLSVGFERVLGTHWSVALEPQFSAESQTSNGAKASAVAVALALRPHFYFLQQAPSGPYIAPFGAVGYSRVTFDFPDGFPDGDEKVKGTVWAVGAGVGWSVVVNARAVFKLSAVFSYAKVAASFGTSGVESSSSSASFNPFVSAGVMF